MSIKILPLELLVGILKYVDDYNTLYSCIRVNKQWHTINIPILWRVSFYFSGSIKILINCLLVEDKDFLIRNNIELKFKLLERPPLCNYIKFATELNFQLFIYKLKELVVDNHGSDEFNRLKKRLIGFILDHSVIRTLKNNDPSFKLMVSNFRFEACFRNLYKLDCNCSSNGSNFFDKVSKICKNIQILKINYNGGAKIHDYYLTRLIKAQNQITELAIHSFKNLVLSDNFKEAISFHSKSIISYESFGENNLDSILIPMFQNLKILALYKRHNNINYLKSIALPCIQKVYFEFNHQSFLQDLSIFIKTNGKNLKQLTTRGKPTDNEYLGTVIQSIGKHCKDLEDLTIFYTNDLDAQLIELFSNCTKLKSITFRQTNWGYKFNGDKILTAMNQTLPKNLKSIYFMDDIDVSVNSIKIFMDNWKGPKPFTLRLYGNYNYDKILERDALGNLLRKYQRLGFLNC